MLFQPTYTINIPEEAEYDVCMAEIEDLLNACKHSGMHVSFDGSKLYYEYFLTENSRGSIVVVHGFTEFVPKYYEMCWYFLQMGYNVFIYDQRGHGLSERMVKDPQIVHIERFEQYVDDLSSFISGVVKPNSQGLPVYIYAHSMGAGIAAQYIYREESTIAKCILSSTMISPSTHGIPPSIVRKLVEKDAQKHGWDAPFRFAGRFSETPDFARSNDLSKPRFDFQLRMRIKERRYQTSSATNRWVYEAVSMQEKLLRMIKTRNTRTEMLIICAGRDKTVRVSSQKRMAKLIPKAKFVYFGNAKHTIYNGTTDMIDRYVHLIIDFFDN